MLDDDNLTNERHQFLKPLGAGGMASVHEAYDTRLDHHMPIKTINVRL